MKLNDGQPQRRSFQISSPIWPERTTIILKTDIVVDGLGYPIRLQSLREEREL